MVSSETDTMELTVEWLNEFKLLACVIQNAYLAETCRENIWTRFGTKFGYDLGNIIIVVGVLYILKVSGS